MRYSQNDAYIIERGGRKKSRNKRRGGAGPAGILIAVLLILTAAICLLVVFLPRVGNKNTAANATATPGKTYYFLCTSEAEDRMSAISSSQYAIERGGAGYIYNDGKYKIIAAVYAKETDVKTLVSVNVNSFYFSLNLPGGEYNSGDKAVIDYLTGEWFDTLLTAATELDRGNITEAAAEYAVKAACDNLRDLALKANSEKLKHAITACTYSPPQTQTVLSYIRYIHVQFVVGAYSALI